MAWDARGSPGPNPEGCCRPTTGCPAILCCFVAGAFVETKSGPKSIEEIEPGDYVWSRDPDTGQEAWREVTETTIRHDIPVLRLKTAATDGSTDALTTTGEHPFWVNGQGWTAARQLEPGDEVFSSAGGWLKVTSATWLQDTRTVYNLEVDGFHTYFVGASGAWVHNACRPPDLSPPGSGRRGAFREAKRHSDIPVSTQPSNVRKVPDRQDPSRTLREYDFDMPSRNEPVTIQDHRYGHKYPDDPSQNRGAHFNTEDGAHFDYE